MVAASMLRLPACKREARPDRGRGVVVRHALARIRAQLREWRRRWRDRRELEAMCDRCLRDIGITRFDAAREARKPFWRA